MSVAILCAAFVAATNIAGTVTFSRASDDYFFAVDEGGAPWRVAADRAGREIAVGERFRAAGERERTAKHRLVAQKLEWLGSSSDAAVEPRKVTPKELFAALLPHGSSDWYGRLVTTEGTLIDLVRRQKSVQLLVGEDRCNFQVELPYDLETHLPGDMVLGARLAVRGVVVYTSIENVSENRANRIENIEIMPMGVEDAVVVDRAPFWTVPRVIWTFAALLLVAALLLAWLMVRRRFERLESEATQRERLRLAADLHDGFQQYLAGSMFRLQAAINLLPADAVASRAQLEDARDALQHTQNGLRSTLWAMTEESEGPQSLMALIRYAAGRMAHWQGIVEIVCEGAERKVGRKLAASLLLIIQEAVGNAIRHGGASRVTVKVTFAGSAPKGLVLEIADDGCGFETGSADAAGHYGLRTMERRVRELGGSMSVESAVGCGTRLRFTI